MVGRVTPLRNISANACGALREVGEIFLIHQGKQLLVKTNWIRWVFASSALYDGILGLVFLSGPGRVFDAFHVRRPNHFGYVQFPALLLIIFAGMFARIDFDPQRLRELMLYGAGVKAAYCSVVFYHHIFGNIPQLWVPLAYAGLAFLALFLAAWMQTRPRADGRKGLGATSAP